MKAEILDISGKKQKDITLPSFFSEKIRYDLILKILEAKKHKQPHSPSPVGGKQHSASGKVKHVRHVWKTSYGKGLSRIPRMIMSRRGSQFNWVGAEIPSTVGGRRAHPPKILSMINTKKINKKELALALKSSIGATADKKQVMRKYANLEEKQLRPLPIIVDSKIANLKTKELIDSLKKILGKELFKISIKTKSVRPGKGKARGRKYKSNAGALIVLGKDEKIKTGAFDIVNATTVGINDLAKGGPGRLTVYTENAIKDLGERIK